MKILYIHQYFRTPQQSGGTRSYWIAQELIANGHTVTFITTDKLQQEVVREYTVDDIKVISYSVPYSQSMSIKERLESYSQFMVKSSKYVLKNGSQYDYVIATSTPLTVGIPALIGKWFRKLPYVFEVRDLWPEVPIQMGAFKNKFVIWLTRYLEKTIYKNASHVVALSPGMQDGVVKYIPKSKTTMIPNMAKMDEFWPRQNNIDLQHQLGLKEDSFKVIHFGSLGIANGAHTIIESAKLMKDQTDIDFLFVGGGSTEQQLMKEVEKHNLKNVKFLGRFPMKEMSEIVNFCDVSLVSFLDLPILYTNSPNKLFDSLSAGKPVIVNSAGWTKDIVEQYHCGYYVNPHKPQELVDKLIYLKQHPSLVAEMGENSRELAIKVYDKSILTKQFLNVLENLKY